ncbi:sigma-70 family RNA polymerase sigma factor [Candidatus Pacearchaeota archaeon]|nr:sigma-70 family RNA polymerase sigma factor [Candidatus Pacearchaeota archaeon]
MLDENKLEALYFKDVERYKQLSKKEEYKLFYEWKNKGSKNAFDKLICSNLKFVVCRARKHKGYINGNTITLWDLIQAGTEGLILATKKFEPKRGYRLISYAVHWIDAKIKYFILNTQTQIRVETTENMRRLGLNKNKLLSIRNSSDPEKERTLLSIQLKVPIRQLREAEKRFIEVSDTIQLDSNDYNYNTNYSGGEGEKHNLITNMDMSKICENLENSEEQEKLKNTVLNSMKKLNDRERFVVKHRYFSDGVNDKTFQQIGDYWNGLSRERIRQIETGAFKKLKNILLKSDFIREKLELV